MALNLRTPGVYVVEESKFPPSVVPVETAIPAFVGYTSVTQYKGESLLNRPVAVNDLSGVPGDLRRRHRRSAISP